MREKNFTVINSNDDSQVGLSCGYIVAECSRQFYNLKTKNIKNWITQDLDASLNINLFNSILNIKGKLAQELESLQIMNLVSSLTGDKDLKWFYIMDLNLFKKMIFSNMKNIVETEGSGWGIFSVNDAILNDSERLHLTEKENCTGHHWFTVAVEVNKL